MAWKCPDCEEINSDNSIVRCVCGYELDALEEPEYFEPTYVKGVGSEIYRLLLFAWPFIPAVLIISSEHFAIIFIIGWISFYWSLLGFIFSVIPTFNANKKASFAAILINTFGLIFWLFVVVYIGPNMRVG